MEPYRLLVIEDVKNIADLICHTATDAGFDAQTANGATAIAAYDSFHPQLIILDLLISGMKEFEFLQFLKERNSKARIMILSGSSYAYRQTAEELARSEGLIIAANISKPFRVKEVREELEKLKKSMDDLRKIA